MSLCNDRFSADARYSRREMLKAGALGISLAGLPRWYVDEALAQDPKEPSKSPNERPGILLVGCGGQGRGDTNGARQFGRVVAVCDVDASHVGQAAEQFKAEARYSDFRKAIADKNVDVVITGTPDHWHTLVNIHALRAGKDVYSEKPLTLTIDEGKKLVEVVQQTGRILQTGSQQRSDARFRLACELVRNGRIGKVKHVQVILPSGLRGGPFATKPVPEGLDWDFWQGQTQAVEYVPERCHFSFRYWYDYSGGTMTDWGAHHNDIALWGLGKEKSGPVTIEGRPLVEPIKGGFTAASEYEVHYTYADGITQRTASTQLNGPTGAVTKPTKPDEPPHGVTFEGSDGWIFVTRGKIQASDPELLKRELPTGAERLYVSNNHMGNFFDCVKTRKPPICEAEIGHRSVSVCHLGVMAIRTARKLTWDPAKQEFTGDSSDANQYLKREMRKPWSYEAV
jgi:myo-inositol 2-dehydrogenase / D-chiro-inositol 1-dehydrogenase